MRRAALTVAVAAASLSPLALAEQPAQVVPQPGHEHVVPRAKFLRAVHGWRAAREQARSLRRTLAHSPDFEVSLRLAGIVYGQDWRHLRACALSEGARAAERHERHNRRLNGTGSGAFGSFQFMRGTFLSTPFAGLDWTRQDVQAFAAAWMWSRGRRNEWAGTGC